MANQENIDPYKFKKGDISSEEAAKRGHNGGIKSGEARRAKRDGRSAARYILDLAAKGSFADNLEAMGLPKGERTNLAAMQARLFTDAMRGNIEAYEKLMKMAGYDPEENRKERESIASDQRREAELNAKVEVLRVNRDNTSAAVNMNDEDGDNDVVIYMPQINSADGEEDYQSEDEEAGEEPQGKA